MSFQGHITSVCPDALKRTETAGLVAKALTPPNDDHAAARVQFEEALAGRPMHVGEILRELAQAANGPKERKGS